MAEPIRLRIGRPGSVACRIHDAGLSAHRQPGAARQRRLSRRAGNDLGFCGFAVAGHLLVSGLVFLHHRGGDAAAVVDLDALVFGPGADASGLVAAGR